MTIINVPLLCVCKDLFANAVFAKPGPTLYCGLESNSAVGQIPINSPQRNSPLLGRGLLVFCVPFYFLSSANAKAPCFQKLKK